MGKVSHWWRVCRWAFRCWLAVGSLVLHAEEPSQRWRLVRFWTSSSVKIGAIVCGLGGVA